MVLQAVESQEIMAVDAAPSAYMLTSDAFLIMRAGGSMWAWIGKAVPLALRDEAFEAIDSVKAENGIAEEVSVEIVKQALEGPLFTAHFEDWDGAQLAAVQEAKRIAALGAEAATAATDAEAAEARKRDLEALAARGNEEPAMVDDGSGTKQVRRQTPHACSSCMWCMCVRHTCKALSMLVRRGGVCCTHA